jgi:hypothetical protein
MLKTAHKENINLHNHIGGLMGQIRDLRFAVSGISRRWYGDGTEIVTGEGKLYLLVTWNPSAERSVGRRPSSSARIPM